MSLMLAVVQDVNNAHLATKGILERIPELRQREGEYGQLPPDDIEHLHRLRNSLEGWLQAELGTVSSEDLATNWARVLKAYAAADAKARAQKQPFSGWQK
jgi:hypothetical protein